MEERIGVRMGRDYGCVITPTDGCRYNIYDETVKGEGVAEMRHLGFAFWCLISKEQ